VGLFTRQQTYNNEKISGQISSKPQNESNIGTGLWQGALALACAVGAYYYAHSDTVPFTGRKRMLDISREQEIQLADNTFAGIREKYSDQILPANHRHSLAVKKVGTKIVEASGIQSLNELDWEFIVIESDEVNAIVLPNGKVCVFSGILSLMKDENGMATVLSHEIAHIVARHSAEHLSLGRVFWGGESVCRFLGFHNMGDWMSTQMARMPFQRFCESEADHIGLILMAKAQYDPTKSIEIWNRLQAYQDHEHVESSPSHPSVEERIQNITGWIPEALQAKQQQV